MIRFSQQNTGHKPKRFQQPNNNLKSLKKIILAGLKIQCITIHRLNFVRNILYIYHICIYLFILITKYILYINIFIIFHLLIVYLLI